jgi:hypothetical protein
LPSWSEAVRRFELLADRGPTPEAFSFKSAFDAQGASCPIDRDRVKALVEQNIEGQGDLLSVVRTLPV